MFLGGGPELSLVFRACFVAACIAGRWSRDPVRTVAELLFFMCFGIPT